MQINLHKGYADRSDWRLIPKRHRAALTAYLTFGQPVAPFLNAVLSNNLISAAMMADDKSSKRLYNFADFLQNYADSDAYGSPEKVRNWIDGNGAHGRSQRHDI